MQIKLKSIILLYTCLIAFLLNGKNICARIYLVIDGMNEYCFPRHGACQTTHLCQRRRNHIIPEYSVCNIFTDL